VKLTPQFIQSQFTDYSSANQVIVGYSGGVDSHVLLHLLAAIPPLKPKITAVYVHHGLQACADDWAVHCQQIAAGLGVKFQVQAVNAQAKQGESPEAAARHARYQAFKQLMNADDILVCAQHRQDQLETVLLQLFRGAGLKGLSGMPDAMRFANGRLLRPLLNISQEAINDYARLHNLHWIEDPSNKEVRFDRNYLRNEIIPLLEQRWPSLDKTVSRVAKHCAEAELMLSQSAQHYMYALYDAQTKSLSISALLNHNKPIQQAILREWLTLLGLRMPSLSVMHAIQETLLVDHEQANPVVYHDGYELRPYRQQLYLVLPQTLLELSQVLPWIDKKKSMKLPANGELFLRESRQGIAKSFWQQASVEIRYRSGGEKMALPYRKGHHRLKKLYQESAIAPWLRDALPLIYINGQLAAIADHWISADFFTQNEVCIQFFWQSA